MFGADQIGDWIIARNRSGMNRVSRQKVPVTRLQTVGFVTDAQVQHSAKDPVRLIFGVSMRTIFGSRRIGPLKHAVAFALQTPFEIVDVRRGLFIPSFDLNIHKYEYVGRLPTCLIDCHRAVAWSYI